MTTETTETRFEAAAQLAEILNDLEADAAEGCTLETVVLSGTYTDGRGGYAGNLRRPLTPDALRALLTEPAEQLEAEDARSGDEPVHGWFGLTYSSYQVLPRVLMQSMPVVWQRQMVALLEQLRDAFSHLDHAEGYDVQAAIEVEASSLTEAQRKATGVTEDWEGDEEDGEFVYHDANGDELESWSRVLVRVAEPLPPYNRGRTRIPLRESEPVELVSGQGVLPVGTPRGFRVGDLVEITGRDDEFDSPRGMQLNGRTGHVTELDPGADYPIGLTVEGWIGPVWCNSGEIRRVAPCPSCGGGGEETDADGASQGECLRCGGSGTVETAGSGK